MILLKSSNIIFDNNPDIFDFQTPEYTLNTLKMKRLYLLSLFIVLCLLLSSCYTRETCTIPLSLSHGGVVVGFSYYYLAQVREFRKPKLLGAALPDGGMSKETRQVFGLFRTDSLANTTQLVYQMPDIYGWPVRYSTRIDKNDSFYSVWYR